MKFGLSKEELTLLEKLVVAPLVEQGATVWIFGSRARGDYNRYSDIDILFRCDDQKALPPGFLYDVKTNIEEARIPFKVDLVNERDLAETYRQSVEKEKIVFSK